MGSSTPFRSDLLLYFTLSPHSAVLLDIETYIVYACLRESRRKAKSLVALEKHAHSLLYHSLKSHLEPHLLIMQRMERTNFMFYRYLL